jgi:hypothetical protein
MVEDNIFPLSHPACLKGGLMSQKKKSDPLVPLYQRLLQEENEEEIRQELVQQGALLDEDFDEALRQSRHLQQHPEEASSEALLALPQPWAHAFLSWSTDAGLQSPLEAIASSSQAPRALAKAARKGLHQLRTRGIKAPTTRVAKEPAFRRAAFANEAPQALAEIPDIKGYRQLYYSLKTAPGNIFLSQIFLSHAEIIEWKNFTTTPKKLRQLFRDPQIKEKMALLENDYARFWIERAARQTPPVSSLSREDHAHYIEASTRLPQPVTFERPPVLAASLQEQERPPQEWIRQSARLHRNPLFDRLWAPPENTLDPIEQAIKRVENSTLLLNQRQANEQIDLAIERAVVDYFTPETSHLVASLLEEVADIFLRRPEQRPDGEQAWAVAWALRQPEADPLQIPFCTELFAKLIQTKKEDSPSAQGSLLEAARRSSPLAPSSARFSPSSANPTDDLSLLLSSDDDEPGEPSDDDSPLILLP